jgi:AAA domain
MARTRSDDLRRGCSFTGVTEPFVKSVRLVPASDRRRVGHPWDLPAIAQLAEGLELHPKVTYLIGENGSGKSSLLSAIAMAAGMNPERGSSNYLFPSEGRQAEAYTFSQRTSKTGLAGAIRLVRGRAATENRLLPAGREPVCHVDLPEQLGDGALDAYGGSRCTSSPTERRSSP